LGRGAAQPSWKRGEKLRHAADERKGNITKNHFWEKRKGSCFERNVERNRLVSEEVIEKMGEGVGVTAREGEAGRAAAENNGFSSRVRGGT